MSGIRSLYRGPTAKGVASAASAPIYVDSDDNIIKFVPAGSGTTEVQFLDASSVQTLTNKTLTSPTLNTPVINGAQGGFAYERLITTRVLTAADSGKVFGLALAGGFTVTLPALAAGLSFFFVVEVAPTTAYILLSAEGGTGNISLVGGAANGAAVVINSAGFTGLQVNLVANLAIIGDVVEVLSVGTAGWAAWSLVSVGGGVTISG